MASTHRTAFGFTSFLAAAFIVSGCTTGPQTSEPEPQAAAPAADTAPAPAAIAPHLSVNELMVTMIDNAGHVLWDAEKEGFAPKDDADWIEIEDHAIQLAAASTLIQLGGTGPTDPVWARQDNWRTDARAMGDAAIAARAAAKGRDLAALVTANTALVQSCESCHQAFKPELPTEGIVHQRPHSESHESNR
jgi:hypothetical protein